MMNNSLNFIVNLVIVFFISQSVVYSKQGFEHLDVLIGKNFKSCISELGLPLFISIEDSEGNNCIECLSEEETINDASSNKLIIEKTEYFLTVNQNKRIFKLIYKINDVAISLTLKNKNVVEWKKLPKYIGFNFLDCINYFGLPDEVSVRDGYLEKDLLIIFNVKNLSEENPFFIMNLTNSFIKANKNKVYYLSLKYSKKINSAFFRSNVLIKVLEQ